MLRGSPSTISLTSYCPHSSSILDNVLRSLFALSRLMISSGWEVINSSSLSATPHVLEPKSSPISLMADYFFFQWLNSM